MLVLGVNNVDCSNLIHYWLLNDTGHVIDVIYILQHGLVMDQRMRDFLLMSLQI